LLINFIYTHYAAGFLSGINQGLDNKIKKYSVEISKSQPEILGAMEKVNVSVECNKLQWQNRSPNSRTYYGVIFNEELELLQVVLQEVLDLVDVFIIVEMNQTHQLTPKTLHFLSNKRDFCRERPACDKKIRHIILGDREIQELHNKHDEFDLNRQTDFTIDSKEKIKVRVGEKPGSLQARIWFMEWMQRSHIAYAAMTDIKEEDLFIWLDTDELLSRDFLILLKHCRPHGESWNIPMPMYIYNFGCKRRKSWIKPAFSTGKELLRLLRKEDELPWVLKNPDFVGRKLPIPVLPTYKHGYGWHMSSFGETSVSRKKMKAYTHSEYARAGLADAPEVLLRDRISSCKKWDGSSAGTKKVLVHSNFKLPLKIAINRQHYVNLQWLPNSTKKGQK